MITNIGLAAHRERQENEKYIKRHYWFGADKILVHEVDSENVTWQGHSVTHPYPRRKFENGIILSNPDQRHKFIYH